MKKWRRRIIIKTVTQCKGSKMEEEEEEQPKQDPQGGCPRVRPLTLAFAPALFAAHDRKVPPAAPSSPLRLEPGGVRSTPLLKQQFALVEDFCFDPPAPWASIRARFC